MVTRPRRLGMFRRLLLRVSYPRSIFAESGPASGGLIFVLESGFLGFNLKPKTFSRRSKKKSRAVVVFLALTDE